MIKVEMQFSSLEELNKFLSGRTSAEDHTTVTRAAPAAEADAAPKPKATKKAKAEPQPAPVEEEEDEEVSAAPAPAPKAEAPKAEKVTFQTLRDIISKHTEVHGLEASKALLNKLGYVKASGIPESEYAAVYAKFEADLD